MKILAIILLAQAAASAPIPGANAVLNRPDLRYIVVGESHGTKQMPAIFGDLVDAAAGRGPVVTVMEHSGADQPLLDAYLASDGGPADRAALLAGVSWSKGMRDGRSSVAMLDLIERLRLLRRQGADLVVLACQPFKLDQMSDYEGAMGQCWRDAGSAHPKARVLVLAGNAHTDRAPSDGRTRAIAQLPAGETLSLVASSAGGQAWNCQNAKCGPFALYPGDARARGVYLTPQDGHFDGVLSAGGAYAASPPAVLEQP